MNEKEKMLQGLSYYASDEILVKERNVAKDLLFAYNQILPSKRKERCALLKQLIHTEGEFQIESPFHCDYGYNIKIGKNFYANHNCVMLDCAPITIGDNVMFGPNVALYAASHPIHEETRRSGLEFALPITIGNDVWIGGSAVLNPGITIGDGVVIASGSVVTKNVLDHVVVAGNPARILRKITDEDREYYYKNQRFTESAYIL